MKKRAKHAPKSLTTSQISFRVVIVAIVVFLIFFAALYLNHRYLYSHFGIPQPALSAPGDTAPNVKASSTARSSREPLADSRGRATDLTFFDRLIGKEPAESPSSPGGAPAGQNQSSPIPSPQKPGVMPPDAVPPHGGVSSEAASASPDNSFTVQVGSFQTLEGAEKVLALLKQQGFEGSVSPVNLSNDRTWYRVRIGRFPVREEAEQVTKKLKESGSFDPLIMPLKKAGE
jgi:cell division septation protein DedD